MRDELHPVADAEHRDAQLEDVGIDRRSAVLEDRIGPAREDDPLRIERPDECEIEPLGGGMDFAIDARFADAPRDELRELRSAVENEDPVHALYHVVGSVVSPRIRSSRVSRCRAT